MSAYQCPLLINFIQSNFGHKLSKVHEKTALTNYKQQNNYNFLTAFFNSTKYVLESDNCYMPNYKP